MWMGDARRCRWKSSRFRDERLFLRGFRCRCARFWTGLPQSVNRCRLRKQYARWERAGDRRPLRSATRRFGCGCARGDASLLRS
jgi:hypothetical protein